MRLHFKFALIGYFSPLLLGLVISRPYFNSPGYGDLTARQMEPNTLGTSKASNYDAPINATTPASPRVTPPLIDISSKDEEENEQQATAPQELPIHPKVTPALGVGGFILLITGAVLALTDLNKDVFPPGTSSYPVTRYIKVELAVMVIVAILGIVSQIRSWRIARDRRAKAERQRQEDQRTKDEAEVEAARQLEDNNLKERVAWDARYRDQGTDSRHKETCGPAVGSRPCAADNEDTSREDKAPRKQSNSNTVGFCRYSYCRARGHDGNSGVSQEPKYNEIRQRDNRLQSGWTEYAQKPTAGAGLGPNSLNNSATMDDNSPTFLTSVVEFEAMSVHSQGPSMADLRKGSLDTANKFVPGLQEAIIPCDDEASSADIVLSDNQDSDSEYYSIAVDSNYQAMLDEEQSLRLEEPTEPAGKERFEGPEQGEDGTAKIDTPQSKARVAEQQVKFTEYQSTRLETDAAAPKESRPRPGRAIHVSPVERSPLNKNVTYQLTFGTKTDSRCGTFEENASRCQLARPEILKSLPVERTIGMPMTTNSAMENATLKQAGTTSHEILTDQIHIPGSRSEKDKLVAELKGGRQSKLPRQRKRNYDGWQPEIGSAITSSLDRKLMETQDAPVKTLELLQTPLHARLPPAVESRASDKATNNTRWHHPGARPQRKNSKSHSSRQLSRLSGFPESNAAHHLVRPGVQQHVNRFASVSSVPPIRNKTMIGPQQEARDRAKMGWEGPPPLIAVREEMIRSRQFSFPLSANSYLRHRGDQLHTDLPQHSSTFPSVDKYDDIPLSQRRIMLHQQALLIARSGLPSPSIPARWHSSSVLKGVNSPTALAAWRELVRVDLKERNDPLIVAQPPVPCSKSIVRSSLPAFGQAGQRNISKNSVIDKTAQGMQRGDKRELHQEAMRRMQAKANKALS
ncbi:hypothetical protein BJX70DRAFT_404288 [Aspergillus crustosus]